MKKIADMMRSELITEVARLRAQVGALGDKLRAQVEECELLRSQNDYLQELLEGDKSDHARTLPVPSDGPTTRPSSPRAIHLDELAAALEASETARKERAGEACPLCGKTEIHAHEFEWDDEDVN